MKNDPAQLKIVQQAMNEMLTNQAPGQSNNKNQGLQQTPLNPALKTLKGQVLPPAIEVQQILGQMTPPAK